MIRCRTVYPLSAIRYLTSKDPVQVTDASAEPHSSDPARVDRGMSANFLFPDSIHGGTFVDFAMPGRGPLRLVPQMFRCGVRIEFDKGSMDVFNFLMPHVYHSISVHPAGQKSRVEKAYKFEDGLGEDWWTTYRYQLEAFVDKVRGRTPQTWPADEPVKQMKWVEQIYAAAGMPPRPASTYDPKDL